MTENLNFHEYIHVIMCVCLHVKERERDETKREQPRDPSQVGGRPQGDQEYRGTSGGCPRPGRICQILPTRKEVRPGTEQGFIQTGAGPGISPPHAGVFTSPLPLPLPQNFES